MERLLLWDLDGTILTTGRVTRDAFYAAVADVLGRPLEETSIRFSGKTDPAIARELLEVAGVPADDIDMMIKRALRKFGPELAARRSRIAAEGKLMPGVPEVLRGLSESTALTTVLTGNIAVNAVCKLDAFRVTSHFDLEIGAFGSDRPYRPDLVGVALDRAAKKRMQYFENEEIWVIGDTPDDLATAQANDVRCLLVATGTYDYEQLSGLTADATVRDLTDTDAVLTLLLES